LQKVDESANAGSEAEEERVRKNARGGGRIVENYSESKERNLSERQTKWTSDRRDPERKSRILEPKRRRYEEPTSRRIKEKRPKGVKKKESRKQHTSRERRGTPRGEIKPTRRERRGSRKNVLEVKCQGKSASIRL